MPKRYRSYTLTQCLWCTILNWFSAQYSNDEVDSLYTFMTDIVETNRYIRMVHPNLISKEMCYEAVRKDFALVTIKMRSTFVRIKRDVAISFPNKIASLGNILYNTTIICYIWPKWFFSGGILGLFTGMSLISIIEVMFWIFRIIFAPFSKGHGSK